MGDEQYPLGIFSTKARFTTSLWARTFWIRQSTASLSAHFRKGKVQRKNPSLLSEWISAPAGFLPKKLCLCLHQHSQARRSGNHLWGLLDRIVFSHLVVLWAETFSVFQGASSPPTWSYKYQRQNCLCWQLAEGSSWLQSGHRTLSVSWL